MLVSYVSVPYFDAQGQVCYARVPMNKMGTFFMKGPTTVDMLVQNVNNINIA